MPETPEQFAQRVKAQHPEYADIPDGALARRILQRYPQYHDMVSLPTALSGDPSSVLAQEAQRFGLQVTSAKRTPAQQKRLIEEGKTKAVHSYHLQGQALDLGGNPAKMRAFYNHIMDTYGGELAEVLDEGNHIHVAWRRPIPQTQGEVTIARTPGGGYKEISKQAGVQQPQKVKGRLAGASVEAEGEVTGPAEGGVSRFLHGAGLPGSLGEVAETGKKLLASSQPAQLYKVGKKILHGEQPTPRELAAAVQPAGDIAGFVKEQVEPNIAELKAGWSAAQKGDTPEAIGRFLLGAIPVVGPQAEKGLEAYKRGDYAGAAGTATLIVVELLGPKAVKGMKKLTPKTVMEAPRPVRGLLGPGRIEATTNIPIEEAPTPVTGKPRLGETAASYLQREPQPRQMIVRGYGSGRLSRYGIVHVDEAGNPTFTELERGNFRGGKRGRGADVSIPRDEFDSVFPERPEGYVPGKVDAARVRFLSDEKLQPIFKERQIFTGEIEGGPARGGKLGSPGVVYLDLESARKQLTLLERLAGSKRFSKLSPTHQDIIRGEIERMRGEVPELPSGFGKGDVKADAVNPAMPPPGGTGTVAEQIITEHPEGMSRFQELGAFVRSQDRVLSSYDSTRPVAETLRVAQDKGAAWTADTMRKAAEPLNNLRRAERFQVGRILDTYDDPATADPALYSPKAIGAAVQVKTVLNDIWSQAKMQAPLGKISSYWTHIERAVGSDPDLLKGIRQNIEYQMRGRGMRRWFGEWFKQEELSGPAGGTIVDTTKLPDSPFRRTRTGATTDIEYDPRRVLPAYIESMAKVIYDRPALEEARAMVEQLPKSRLREYAELSVRNFANFSVYPEFQQAWNRFTGAIAKQTGRAMVGFYPGIQTLHLARVPLLLTELGAGDWAAGVAEVARHPVASFQQVARMGMLPNFVEPWELMKPGAKLDAVANLFGVADYLDRAVAYKGFTRKFLREGLTPEQAHWKAIAESKKMSFFVDRTRAVGAFTQEGPAGALSRLTMQFKHQPIKMVEYYSSIAAELKASPMKAVRLAAITAGLVEAANLSGLRLWHLGPTILEISGASATVVTKIVKDLEKGDVEGAMGEAALWAIPGGYQLRRIAKGTAFGQEPEKKVPKQTLVPRAKKGEGLQHLSQ